MTKRLDLDALLDNRQTRRMKEEDRFLARLEKREAAADALIGELIRDGKTVFYINLTTRNGNLTGKTREGARFELTDYLIRNHYV